jgi:hypothetical protein
MSWSLRAVPVLLILLQDCGGLAPERTGAGPCPDGPLLQGVREAGSVRVIVGLALEVRPEAELTAAAAAAQRQRIAAAQDSLLAELGTEGITVIRRYQRLPQLALQVDETRLCRLLASARVASVHADREDPPGAG